MAHRKSYTQARLIKPRKNRLRVIIFICLIGALSIFFISLSMTHRTTTINNSVDQTVLTDLCQSQLQSLNQNNLAIAYAMTSSSFQQGVDLEEFKRFLSPIINGTELTFTQVTMEGHFGFVAATIMASNQEKLNIEWQFIQENNSWKIQAIRFTPIQPTEKTIKK